MYRDDTRTTNRLNKVKDFSSSFHEKESKERKYLHMEQNVRSVEITHTHSHTRLKERGVEESKRVTKFFFKKSFSIHG